MLPTLPWKKYVNGKSISMEIFFHGHISMEKIYLKN